MPVPLVVLCAGGMRRTCLLLLLALQKRQLGFSVSWPLVVHNLPHCAGTRVSSHPADLCYSRSGVSRWRALQQSVPVSAHLAGTAQSSPLLGAWLLGSASHVQPCCPYTSVFMCFIVITSLFNCSWESIRGKELSDSFTHVVSMTLGNRSESPFSLTFDQELQSLLLL